MKHFKYTKEVRERGITLLITLLLMGVLLGVSTSLLNITLKQYQLAGIALSSEVAFQTANAGLECILYHDFPEIGDSPFEVGDNEVTNLNCFDVGPIDDLNRGADGDNTIASGNEQRFQYTWGTAPNEVCSDVSIYKFSDATNPVPVEVDGRTFRSDCPAGSVCTVVQARGYNVSCANIDSHPRVVEREYTLVY